MRKHKVILTLCAVIMAFAGCNGKDDLPSVIEDGEVAVRFAVADALVARSGVFASDVPVKVLVFRRSNLLVAADVTGTPYRTFVTVTDGSGGLKPATGGKTLSVMSGYTYDFYVMVNPPANEVSAGTWNVQHGTDLLAGSILGKAVSRSSSAVTVDFGDLPHLCSQVQFEAAPMEDMIPVIPVTSFSVSKVTWSKLPVWGTLALSDVQKVTTSNSYTGSFELVPTTGAGVLASNFKVSDKGVVLPFPATYTATTNRIDMKFLMELNGGGVTFDATNVEIPAFKPGYIYKFIMDLQLEESGGEINLMLSIAPWNSVNWNAGMGGDNESISKVQLGSWKSISWSAGMGGDGPMTILSVGGWRSLTWTSSMGEE